MNTIFNGRYIEFFGLGIFNNFALSIPLFEEYSLLFIVLLEVYLNILYENDVISSSIL